MERKIKSNLKKILVSVLVVAILLTSLGGTVTALAEELSATTDNMLNSLSSDYYSYTSGYVTDGTGKEIKSFSVKPIKVLEYTNGYWNDYGEFIYTPSDAFECLIEYTDGTSCTMNLSIGDKYHYAYPDYYYYLTFDSNQEYETWQPGNTYTATVTLNFCKYGKVYYGSGYWDYSYGYYDHKPLYTTYVDVSVIGVNYIETEYNYDNPFKIVKDTNQFTKNGIEQYYPYGVEYKIHFSDGSTYTTDIDRSKKLYFFGEQLSIDFISDQRYEKWLPGNIYSGYVSIGNIGGFNLDVEILGVTDFKIKPISIIENTEGYNKGWYYRYSPDYFSYSISLTDGRTLNGSTYTSYNSINLTDGNAAYLTFSSNQSSSNPWVVGNTYEGNVHLKARDYYSSLNDVIVASAPVAITIVDADYKSIEIIDSKSINENDYSYIDENGHKHYQIPEFTYKVNLRNGGYELGRYSPDYYSGAYSDYISVQENQYEIPWSPYSENEVTVKIGSVSTSFFVKMESAPDYDYIEQDGGLFITGSSLNIENMIIPSKIDGKPVLGVMSLGRSAESIKKLTIPNSVKFLSDSALGGAWQLETLTIGSAVNNLTVELIANCYNLKTINISSSNPYYKSQDGIVYNKQMNTLILYPISKGNTYNVPDHVTNIDVLSSWCYSNITPVYSDSSSGFRTLDGITYTADMKKIISCDENKTGNYNMPISVEEIAPNAFAGSNLTSVTVSKNVTEIVYATFYCSSIESITLPENLQSIEARAFEGTESLKSINLPTYLTKIEEHAFQNSAISEIVIPASVKGIGYSTFADTYNLKRVVLNEGIEKIGSNCFAWSALEEIIIPNSVTDLGEYAFYCSALSKATIGKGLSQIKNHTFVGTEIEKIVIPKNITEIGTGAFSDCNKLTEVVFENDSVKIGISAFASCPLEEINLGKNVSQIGKYAFMGNNATSINFPDSVTEITYGSFSEAANLIDIDLPDNIKKVGGRAFDNTLWYDSQENGVLYLENVLYGVKGGLDSTSVTVNDGTTVIADYAFENSDIRYIELPDTLKTIGKYAFHDSSLEEIYIPASVELIDEHAFAGCQNLRKIYVDSGNRYYSSNNGVLCNKEKTELIYCPSHWNCNEYDHSWGYCRSNDNYTIPYYVKFVRNYAFEDNGILSVTVLNDETIFDEYAFADTHDEYEGTCIHNERVVTFVCNEDSIAYAYAKRNMYEIEPLPLIDEGVCGENVRWRLDDYGNLHITGAGEMDDYRLPTLTPWYKYRYDIEEIVISADVTKIGNNCFGRFYSIGSIYIKNTDMQFGMYAIEANAAIVIKAVGGGSVEVYANQNGNIFLDIRKPDAPLIANLSQDKIELMYDSKYEYSMDGINWQTSNVFTDFDKNKILNFYQRVIGGEQISDATKCIVASAPDVLVGSSEIQVKAIEGFEYALDDEIWQSGNVFEKYIIPGETYTVYQRPIAQEGVTVIYDKVGTTVVVNGDQRIEEFNSTHLVWLRKILLSETESVNLAADINEDGKVDIKDLVCLKKKLAEIA